LAQAAAEKSNRDPANRPGAGSRKWLYFAITCLVLWGIFGFLSKLGSGKLPPGHMQVLFTLGTLPLFIPACWRSRGSMRRDRAGAGIALPTGMIASVANLALFAAMRRGSASVVAPMTGLYPMVTFFLAAIVLRERMNRFQYLGAALAFVAILLLSLE
jgi:transporter family protein